MAGLLGTPFLSQAHLERLSFFPDGRVDSPPAYRPLITNNQPTLQSPRLVVCKRPGDEGVGDGEDSASIIADFVSGPIKQVNQQLLNQCQFSHIQAAVDAVTQRGTTIYVLPGLYKEEPSIRARDENFGAADPVDRDFCQAVFARGEDDLSYEEQFRCPFIQNTVAIFGDRNFADDNCGDSLQGECANPETVACDTETSACEYYDLQIEGTGQRPEDTILEGLFINEEGVAEDGQFAYLNGIRADRADGFYLRNITAQIFEFNAVYVLETDGYVFDRVLTRWNDEYGFLSFAADHGLYEFCEGYGNADSVFYPGSGADIFKGNQHSDSDLRTRSATEIRFSKGHHNSLAYSGTAGNAAYVHDNEFYKNTTGMATESIFPDHPGMPQDHALWENNLIYNNNNNFYRFVGEGLPCNALPPRDRGLIPDDLRGFDDLPPEAKEAILDKMVVCPVIPFPLGTALIIAGGNYDVLNDNDIFDNWSRAVFTLAVQRVIRDEDPLPPQYENGHFNHITNNRLAMNPLTGQLQPNGTDFWWDGAGVGNCWADNTSAAGDVTMDGAITLPITGLPNECGDGPVPSDEEVIAAGAFNNSAALILVPCLAYDRDDPATKNEQLCDFFAMPPEPAGREGSREAIASQPTEAEGRAGEAVKSGYFVLNNNTGATHQVSSVTIEASGDINLLSALTLEVNGTTVTLEQVGESNEFVFEPAVELRPLTMNLFDLNATVAGGTTGGLDAGSVVLASTSGAAMLGFFAIVGVGRRRRVLLLATALLSMGLMASCSNSDNDDDGSAPRGNASFEMSELSVDDGSGEVNYTGLPLDIGSLDIR